MNKASSERNATPMLAVIRSNLSPVAISMISMSFKYPLGKSCKIRHIEDNCIMNEIVFNFV